MSADLWFYLAVATLAVVGLAAMFAVEFWQSHKKRECSVCHREFQSKDSPHLTICSDACWNAALVAWVRGS